jgi:hypothetical protein
MGPNDISILVTVIVWSNAFVFETTHWQAAFPLSHELTTR